jgi:hypothetical protein
VRRAVGPTLALALLTLWAVGCGDDTGPAAGEAGPTAGRVAQALCGATPVMASPAPTGGPAAVPVVASPALAELSGLVASTRADRWWWAHNDSGNDPRLHLVGPDGEDGGSTGVQGAANVDWEDLARGPGPDGDLLYIGDIGNNEGDRPTVSVEVVAEPDPAAGLPPSLPVERTLELTWPEEGRNAEVLLVDPRTSELVVITQDFLGPAGVYTADGTGDGPRPLELVGTVDLRRASTVPPEDLPLKNQLGLGAATAGDVTAAGDAAMVRTYGTAFVWPRDDGQTLAEAIVENDPCEAPTFIEDQGEALAVDPDGGGYRTIGEGIQPPVNRFTTGG